MKEIEKKEALTFELVLSLLVTSIIPFLMYLHLYDPQLGQYDWFPTQADTTDFFLYIKMCAITVVGICMLGILIFYGIKKKINFKLPVIYSFLGGYLLLAILSAVFSINRDFSLKGSYEQFEPVPVLIAYGIINIFSYYFICNINKIKKFINIWSVSVLILCMIGVLQFIGKDPFSTNIFKKLITPRQYWDAIEQIDLITESNRTYLTFFNPNYVGLFTSFTIPIFLVLLIKEHNKKRKIINALILVGLVVCTIGSRSKNTIIAVILPLVLIFIILRQYWIKHIRFMLLGVLTSIVLILGLNAYGGNIFGQSIVQAFYIKNLDPILKDIELSKDGIYLKFSGAECLVNYTLNLDNTFFFEITNNQGEEVNYHYDSESNKLVLEGEQYFNTTIMPISLENIFGISININGKNWIFTKDSEGSYQYYNGVHKWTTMQHAKTVDLFPERLFTGRGYVWNRTIPLLKDTILLGKGPDTFVLSYPQDDYVSNYNQGYENTIVTKPHNLYLQIGVETGVVSLICFLIFYFLYFIKSIKLYWKCSFESEMQIYGLAIFVGTIGFMISSLVNDSTVCVSPIFWAIWGIGIRINYEMKHDVI